MKAHNNKGQSGIRNGKKTIWKGFLNPEYRLNNFTTSRQLIVPQPPTQYLVAGRTRHKYHLRRKIPSKAQMNTFCMKSGEKNTTTTSLFPQPVAFPEELKLSTHQPHTSCLF